MMTLKFDGSGATGQIQDLHKLRRNMRRMFRLSLSIT